MRFFPIEMKIVLWNAIGCPVDRPIVHLLINSFQYSYLPEYIWFF